MVGGQRATQECIDRAKRITELYDLHERGELPGDCELWLEFSELLSAFAHREVRRVAKGLYGSALEHATELVETELLTKIVARKFSPREGRDLEPVLRVAAHNAFRGLSRRSRSPSTVGFDGAEETWESGAPVEHQMDHFGAVRQVLRDFRFPDHNTTREAILAYYLSTRRYPGPRFLADFGVPASERDAVYNAAVVDLNCAMQAVCGGDLE